ncbi:MAG TPA: hypothetical protein VEC02_04915 [Nitrososphaerales archaeon]|nr:hypothetical protein [Nitrososphaerales archaeon]
MAGIDITVVTLDKPSQSVLQSFIRSHPEFYLISEADQKVPLIKLRGPRAKFGRKAAGDEEPMLVYGPYHVFEADDMEADVAALVPAPCWQIEVSSAVGSEEAWRDALALAEHVAKACKGAVWSAELGVAWPPNVNHNTKTERRRIDLLKLEWVAHRSRKPVKSGQAFLRTLQLFLPEARPTRFGLYTPLQERLDPKDDRPFTDFWEKCFDQNLGHMSFRSRSPLVEGFVFFPRTSRVASRARSWGPPVRPTEELVKITLEFDEKAVSDNAQLCERIVRLFMEVARRLQCFYARGYVERKFSWYRSEPMEVPLVTELYPDALGYEWMGIPAEPTWLTWFGRPYVPLVAKSVEKLKPRVAGNGMLIRLGSKPADLRQLRKAGVKLPSDVLVQRAEHDQGDELMAKLKRAGMWSPPSFRPRNAEVIPRIDG